MSDTKKEFEAEKRENSKKFWRRADVVAWTETLGAAE